MEELRTIRIISKAENIADVLLRHLSEEEGCKHRIHAIVDEAFGPRLEGQDHHQINRNHTKEVTT